MTDFDAFSGDFHRHFTADANACVFLGVSQRLGELPDPSLAWADSQVASARSLLGRLEAISREGLSFDQRLDLDIARLELERDIHGHTCTFNGARTRQQFPRAGDAIGDGIFLLFANDPRPDEERLADVTARLERVPEYLAELLRVLERPVERWVAMDQEQIDGLPTLFDTLVDWAEKVGWADRRRLTEARAGALTALRSYGERLSQLPTTTAFSVGEAEARVVLKTLGIEMSPDELRRAATEFLASTGEIIEELRGRLAARYDLDATATAEEVQVFLSRRFAVERPTGSLDDILDRYRAERDRVLAFVCQRDLFPIFDEQQIEILRTPSFMLPSIPAGAMMPPAPFREGTATSLVYLTLSDELLEEHTELSIPGMMLHEGIPGHHLQFATAFRHPSVIRKHGDSLHHGEGWTTMLEDYMLDVGYMGELADEARFIAKRDISRLGARAGIDLAFMTGDRSYLGVGVDCDLASDDLFEAAGNLLQEVTGFSDGRVQSELNWYSQQRGYPLSYLTGNRLVLELKRDLIDYNAGRLEGPDLDRVFHRIYLESGSMPISLLRRVFAHEGLLAD
jgi:uncharacterized protein (DUF885 family)